MNSQDIIVIKKFQKLWHWLNCLFMVNCTTALKYPTQLKNCNTVLTLISYLSSLTASFAIVIATFNTIFTWVSKIWYNSIFTNRIFLICILCYDMVKGRIYNMKECLRLMECGFALFTIFFPFIEFFVCGTMLMINSLPSHGGSMLQMC